MKQWLAVTLCLVGCGGGLNPEFEGLWRGNVTTSVVGGPSETRAVQQSVSVQGREASFAGMCQSAPDSIALTGDGDFADWSGKFACAPFVTTNCNRVVFTYTAGSASLTSSRSLRANFQGDIEGCGSLFAFNMAFEGTK